VAPARTSIERALAFLAAGQAASGQIPVRTGLEMTIDETTADPSIFATALVAEALGPVDHPLAASTRGRAAEYLRGHMEEPGVWRHWTRGHPQFHSLPPDADDTACASVALRHAGVPYPDNRSLLLANRDAEGRFFTWLVARRGSGLPGRSMWRIAGRRVARPVHARLFWRTSAEPDDVDGIVNLNVLAYLGDGSHAGPIVRYAKEILDDGREAECDSWYRSPFLFYAGLGRCVVAGVDALGELAPTVGERIAAAAGPDGQIGDGPLDTALALRALIELDIGDPARDLAFAYLETTQEDDGGWPAAPLYFGGPRHHPDVPCWGSRELTAGICVGALARLPKGGIGRA
jgi:hypothetical protein